MTLLEQLREQAANEGDTEVSARARLSTNPIARKLYQAGDVLGAVGDDWMDTAGNEDLENAKLDAAWNRLLPSKDDRGNRPVHQEYWYDSENDTYVPLVDPKLSANELVYTKEELEAQADEDSKVLYDAHYASGDVNKIGIAGINFDKRHPLGRTMGANVVEDKVKDADYVESEIKDYMMSQNANVYKKEGLSPRKVGDPAFTDLGLNKGKSEVFKGAEMAMSLDDIAGAIDTAKTPEEKAILKHRFDLMQERVLKNKKTANKMKFLQDTRKQLEGVDEKDGGTLSPTGFGNFREELTTNNKLFEAYKDLYNQEDTTGDLEGKTRSMQTLMIEQFMSEKSNQIQEAIEDLGLSKNESAIMSDLLGIYRASDLTPGQATQAVANSVFDPANLGPAALAGKVSKYGSKAVDAITSLFKKEPVSKKTKQVLAGAAGGAGWTGAEDAARQQVDVNAQYKDKIDLKQVAIATGAGAVLGGGIVKGLQVVSDKVGNLLKSKKIEEATTPEEVSKIVEEVKKDETLSPDEQIELDKYEYEVMQAGEELPSDYKTLKGSKDKADEVADTIEAEVATDAKPKVAEKIVEKEEEPTVTEKEKEEDETEKIVVKDKTTGEDVEIDLGTTEKGTNTPIAQLDEASRLPLAKEFILGKERIKRVGDDTTTEGDIPLSSPQQAHKQGRAVSTAAVDKAQRTVEQKVPVKATPEESVDAVMKSYRLYNQSKSLDPDKRIEQSISDMEHRVLAIEGMRDHYKEKGIDGDFTALDKQREELLSKIKERSGNINDKQVEFNSKAEFAKENLPSPDRELELKTIEKTLTEQSAIKDVPAFIEAIRKVTDFALGQRVLQRIKKDNNDQILPEDIAQATPMIREIQKILKATDGKGQPLSPKKVREKLQQATPQIIKNVLGGANDDASKIVALRMTEQMDKAAGFNRQQGTTVTKPQKTEEPIGSSKKGKPKDTAREQVVGQWKLHNAQNEKKNTIRALNTDRYDDVDGVLTGEKGQIYSLLKQRDLSAKDRAELMEALTHEKTQSQTMSPLELTKTKKEKYIERKNNEKSMQIFGKPLEAERTTPVTSTRALFDASSQVAQIVGAFFGDINLFKAIGATKGTKDADYRMAIAKVMKAQGLIPDRIKKIKDVVKIPTRNVTYVEGRSRAIQGLINELDLEYNHAAKLYDGIMRELGKGPAKGLLDFANKIAKHVQNGEIPAKFELTLPSGKKVKVDARQEAEFTFKKNGVEFKSKKKADEARPGTIAATIVQSIDSYIKDDIISKMTDYDGITVHDGFAFKTDAQKAEATKIYFDALKKVHEDNYLNKTLNEISGGKIPLVKNKELNWDDIVPEGLFSVEFHQGEVPEHEIKTNKSLNSDRLMEETEILANLLNSADPTGKLGFTGLRHSVVRFLSKSEANRQNPKTNLSELDEFTSVILRADSAESMQRVSDWWRNKWMKKNGVKPSATVDDAFEKLTNIARATAESIPEFTGGKLMEREQVMNQYARIYFKNLAEKDKITLNKTNKTLEKNIGKDTTIEKIFEVAEPEDIPDVMTSVKEVVETENAKDIPTKAQERKVLEEDGETLDDTIELSPEAKKSFDESYKMVHSMNNQKRLAEADISHATYNMIEIIKKTFSKNNIDRDMFKKYILDSGYRHIRGMTKDQADRFTKMHKGTIEKYGKYIDAKARAHTNPNERYGYFRNNILMLVMEKENIPQAAAEVRANAILKLSAIKNMTDQHWRYAETDGVKQATKEFLDNVDVWDKASRDVGFTSGKENYNDSYLATVREKPTHKIDEDVEVDTDNHTLGKIVDDEATLKSLNETTNLEGYMENHKIRKVGDQFYRILIDERAEKQIMGADPMDILSKTIFTAMAKTAGSDQTKNVRALLRDGNIFGNEKTRKTEPLTESDIKFLADRAGLKPEDITVTHKDKVLGRQIFGKTVYTPFGKKAQDISAKITQAFKYNAVPINPNSGINGALYTIVKTLGQHPIKGLPALIKATKQMHEYKTLDNNVKKFLAKGDMDNYKKAWDDRAKHPVFQAINEGMSINKLDGISTQGSLLHGSAKKVFGKDTKKLHVARTIFLRPHTPIADTLIKFFSASDSIGRMAEYNILKGTDRDTGVGAGIKANYGFGNMSHVSSPMIETLDTFLLTAFVKWGERTFIELIKLPRAQQLTLMASGLMVHDLMTEYDIEDKGFNPLRIAAEIPDDFIVSPITDTYDKYSGDTSMFEHAVRASAQLVLPAPEKKLLMSYLFDQRNGSVNKKMIKLIFPPTGKNWSDDANGKRVRASGKMGSLTDWDGRAWWEQMVGRPSKVTKEQYEAGEWRNDVNEFIWGKEQMKDWKKLNYKEKKERAANGNPAYSCNFF